MNPQIEPELLAEMTLFPPEPNQPARTTRPPPVQFTKEQIEAARKNPWVIVNSIVPQVAVRSKPKG